MPTSVVSGAGGSPLDESEAIERARRGDGDAYEFLVVQFQNLAFRTAYVITGDASEAEEAAQTGFVKAYFALDSFRSGEPFRPWLLRIVANEARNRRKSRASHPTLDLALIEGIAADPAMSPEANAEAADRNEQLINVLNCLREEDRAIITYRYFLDLTESEMADALGCRKGTVKSRLSRAMNRLREQYDLMGGRNNA